MEINTKQLSLMVTSMLKTFTRTNTRGSLEDLRGTSPPPSLLATNQTKIPYPKTLKQSMNTKLRLNESKNNSLDIFPYH